MRLLRELRSHGEWRHWGRLLRGLSLREEGGVGATILCDSITGGELLGLEVVLAAKRSRLSAAEVGLSITIKGSSAVAVRGSIASVLRVAAKRLTWSIFKASTTVPVPTAAVITPSSGVPIPTIVPVVVSATSWTTWKVKRTTTSVHDCNEVDYLDKKEQQIYLLSLLPSAAALDWWPGWPRGAQRWGPRPASCCLEWRRCRPCQSFGYEPFCQCGGYSPQSCWGSQSWWQISHLPHL